MKLLARLVLSVAGGIYLPAVIAGRLMSARGGDFLAIVISEAAGAIAGIPVAWALMSLGRRRRPAALRVFSDLASMLLGAMWLALLADVRWPLDERWWRVAGYAWATIAALVLIAWVTRRRAWEVQAPSPRARWPEQ